MQNNEIGKPSAKMLGSGLAGQAGAAMTDREAEMHSRICMLEGKVYDSETKSCVPMKE